MQVPQPNPDSPEQLVTPPRLGRPVVLRPFSALMLAPHRISDPSAGRAFARPYKDVVERLRQWQETGQVLAEPDPAVFLHEYTAGGLTVRGLVGLLDLGTRSEEPYRTGVFPHEAVHPGQVGDLAARMDETRLNPAPILLVHRGPENLRHLINVIGRRTPDRSYPDRVGTTHRLWAIRDSAELAVIDEALAASQLLIADGHHRYAAYLRQQETHPDTGWGSGLAMVVDQEDTPLFLGAIHRVLRGTTLRQLELAAAGLAVGTRRQERIAALSDLDPDTLVATDGSGWLTLRLPRLRDQAAVQWVHETLTPLLTRDPLHPLSGVDYHHSTDAALASAHQGVALLLPAPDITLLERVAARGRVLPEKATSFQPKPPVGVLMRTVD